MNQTNPGRKLSSSTIIIIACVFGIAIGLLGLNIWHASKCSTDGSTSAEIDEYVQALNRRLLQAESQVKKLLL